MNYVIIFLLVVLIYVVDSLRREVYQSLRELQENERKERIDLYNRLMSKDLADYHTHTHSGPPKPRTSNNNFLKDAHERAVRNTSDNHSFGGDD